MYLTLAELKRKENYNQLKYVTCDIKGGLGNQLFMIFATLAYAICILEFFLHLWTFKTPIFQNKKLNDLNQEFILTLKSVKSIYILP